MGLGGTLITMDSTPDAGDAVSNAGPKAARRIVRRGRRAAALAALAIAATQLLPACGQLGYFLEWPRVATVPEVDWVDATAGVERLELPHPTLEGARVSAVRAGDPSGRRVVFVHGSPGDASNWASYLEACPEGYEYVSIDRPGFGFTTPVDSVASLDDQAAAVLPFLETPSGRGVVLVGWSYGGPVIARVAAAVPERVAGLVIVAGALDPDLEKVRFLQRVGCVWPFNRFVRDTWRIANEELIPLARELEKLREHLPKVEAPVRVLHGEQDSLVPFANVAYMAEQLSGSRDLRLVTFEDERHFLPFTRAEAVVGAIEELAQLP